MRPIDTLIFKIKIIAYRKIANMRPVDTLIFKNKNYCLTEDC